MGDHFRLDTDPALVAGAARSFGRLGGHLRSRGTTAASAPERWAHGWHGHAATAVGAEATTLAGHLGRFAEHFEHAAGVLADLARDLEQAQDVEVPDLNRRWAAAEAAYEHAVQQAASRFASATAGIGADVPPQTARLERRELSDSRAATTSAASGERSAAQHKLELEYDDVCDRLTRHARRVSAALTQAVAVPVPPALVAAYRVAQGNAVTRALWSLGGDLVGDLATSAAQQLGGPLDRLRDQLRQPPQDYAAVRELLHRARDLGVPPPQYAPTLESYWQYRAAEVAGLDLDQWDPAQGADVNRATIEAVYRYYGDVYLSDPDLQWAGMANMIGPSFAAGFFDLAQLRRIAEAATDLPTPLRDRLPDGVEDLANLPEDELRYYETTFLDMQRQIFLDQGSMHQAYRDGGLDAVTELEQAGLIDRATLDGWRDIASGDPDRVQRGNEAFLLREQRDIIDDDYQRMYDHDPTGPAMTWAMTLIGAPSIPGARGYAEVFPLHVQVDTPGPQRLATPHSVLGHEIPHVDVDNPTQVHVDVTTPLPDGDIAAFDDRWALIRDDTLPVFQRLLRDHPDQARRIIASDVPDRIAEYRMTRRVDDIVGHLLDWDVDVDQ